MKGRIKPHGLIGVALFCLAVVMLGQGREPFTTYFYSFAWWSYILAVDALVYWRQGESLIVSQTRTFLRMIPLSIFIWCIFEAFNFRLANWHYINLPPQVWMRWIGYAIAYGTVLPGLCETMHLLRGIRPFRAVSGRKLHPSPLFLRTSLAMGGSALLVTLLFPRACFPLVWIGFALLIEPILYLRRGDSLLLDIEKGELSRLLTLLAAGLACGLFWESWNFWAQAKWIYTVPFFEEGKLFEMPLLGFLGFPPFAVSAYAMYRVLLVAMHRGGIWQRSIWWLLIALFCLLTFAGIDRHTTVSFIPLIKDLPGVQAEWKERLQKAGMEKVQDLIPRKASGLVDLGIPRPEAEELLQKAEMITLKGMGIENYCLLREAGVMDLAELAHQDPHYLYLRIQKTARLLPTPHRTPFPALVRFWVREAKKRVE
ncbi:MAG: DUF4332 domain-containing protein [Desulfobacterales bacterium]|nr:DUF4332 domain-containing protein [Desulfobacterales bacterium]